MKIRTTFWEVDRNGEVLPATEIKQWPAVLSDELIDSGRIPATIVMFSADTTLPRVPISQTVYENLKSQKEEELQQRIEAEQLSLEQKITDVSKAFKKLGMEQSTIDSLVSLLIVEEEEEEKKESKKEKGKK